MSTAVVLNLTSSGHINPSLPMVSELVKRGERVIYYGIEDYREIIEGSGAEYRGYDHPDFLVPKTHQGELFSVMAHFTRAAQAILPGLLKDLEELEVDYILLDSMCIWGNLVQQIMKLPAITFSSIFLMHPKMKVDDMIDMTYSHRPKETIINGLKSLYNYLEVSKEIEGQYPCKCPGLIGAFTNPQPVNLLFTAKDFHPMSEKYSDENYKFVGPSILDRQEKEDFPFDELDTEFVIFISLGTINNQIIGFYKDCYEAFGNRNGRPFPHKVILSIGKKVNQEEIGEKPDNFIVVPRVPQLEVLQRVDLFITHGGMNSVGEALYFGVPMVVIPRRGDQFLVAQQVDKTGTGVSMSVQEATPEELYDIATSILATPTFKENARKMSDSFKSAGGYVRAADEVIAYTQTFKNN